MSGLERVPEANEIIHILSIELKNILKNRLIGLYVHGSPALGDFNPDSSDIDFLVVTEGTVSGELFPALESIHSNIISMHNRYADRLEISFIPQDLLQLKYPPDIPRPYINEGSLCLATYGYEWVLEKYIVREHGITIPGPNSKELISVMLPEELHHACSKMLEQWWAPMLSNTSRLKDNGYQPYAVLTTFIFIIIQ